MLVSPEADCVTDICRQEFIYWRSKLVREWRGLGRRRSWIAVKSQLGSLLILDPIHSSETRRTFTSKEKPSDGGGKTGPFVPPQPQLPKFWIQALFSEGVSKLERTQNWLHVNSYITDIPQTPSPNSYEVCGDFPDKKQSLPTLLSHQHSPRFVVILIKPNHTSLAPGLCPTLACAPWA